MTAHFCDTCGTQVPLESLVSVMVDLSSPVGLETFPYDVCMECLHKVVAPAILRLENIDFQTFKDSVWRIKFKEVKNEVV